MEGRSWPLSTSLEGPCALREGNISVIIESVVENIEGTAGWELSTWGSLKPFLGPLDPYSLLASKRGLGWVLREACV